MYGASYILYVAANTCMVRAVLYCTVLRAFSHFHAICRCFPYNSARNSYFPLHLCAGPVGDSGAQINQPTGARVQTSTSLDSLASTDIQYENRPTCNCSTVDLTEKCMVLGVLAMYGGGRRMHAVHASPLVKRPRLAGRGARGWFPAGFPMGRRGQPCARCILPLTY